MLISLRWLRDYVDIDMSPHELAGRLTMAGLEVESVQERAPGFSGVVVAKILSVAPHPGADKLKLCLVSAGGEARRVVCGAPNVKEGTLVPLATVGATIPGGFTVKRSKIRGEVSEGMLCSEDELGIGDDASGLMILPAAMKPGEDLAAALDLNDVVFDISVTPNRSDCLSVIGIAREVAALTGRTLKYPAAECSETSEDITTVTSIDILAPELCPRYTARIIRNVTMKPSPAWMRMRLESVGLRAINNVVDVTNFVMMEFGQPLHAFDFRYLEEGRIVVRGAKEGEAFVSLDEKTRILGADTLMIGDGVKPVAVAGIMGGLNSEVVDDTETVLLESAFFNPSSIRKSARLLGMGTEASFRFERKVDPEGVIRALNRAARLIAETAGGSICMNYIDQYPRKIETARDIRLRMSRVNDITGMNIDAPTVLGILKRLEMDVKELERGVYSVTPPTFRVDIEREIDLIEEIARLHGFDHIPVTIPAISSVSGAVPKKQMVETELRNVLIGSGYTEVINYSFTTPQSVEITGLDVNDERRKFVVLKNPLSEDMSVMRTTLVHGLLETMKKNVNLGNTDLRLFEIGKVYIAGAGEALPAERERLGALIQGNRHENGWHFKDAGSDFYDLKGCLENCFTGLRIVGISYDSRCREPFLHPGRACYVKKDDRVLGFLGEIHPDLRRKLDMKESAVVCELDCAVLVELAAGAVTYRDIPRYPSVSRDVAFLIDETISSATIIGIIRAHEEVLLEDVYVFDVYSGTGIPGGMKSFAFRFTYRASDRTLTDADVDRVHSGIIERVTAQTGAKIRGSGE